MPQGESPQEGEAERDAEEDTNQNGEKFHQMMSPRTEEMDPLAILAALGVTGAARAEPVTGGTDTAIWRVEVAGSVYALRLFRPEQRETAHREQLAMRAAASGLPVPHIHAGGFWHDRPALLLSWCAGQPFAHLLLKSPRHVLRLGARFGQMHARIHAVPAPAELQEDLHAWMTWAGPIEAPLQARLQDAAGQASTLLHLDYHPMNVMTDGEKMTAVLDWANAHAGDPRADLARTVTLFRLSPWNVSPRWRETMYRRLLELAWLAGYTRTAGYPAGMTLFYAWAGAAMLHDYAPRLSQPGSPYTPAVMDQIRCWTLRWKRRAGVL